MITNVFVPFHLRFASVALSPRLPSRARRLHVGSRADLAIDISPARALTVGFCIN
jgi:hypothetical protein